jgi:hypothetical protein
MNTRKFGLLYVFLFILLLLPHKYIGDSFSNSIAALLCIILLIVYIKDIKINLKYFSLLIMLIISGFITMIFSHNLTESFSGILIYFIAVMSYIIFRQFSNESDKIIKFIVYVITGTAIIFIIFQGSIYKLRIC